FARGRKDAQTGPKLPGTREKYSAPRLTSINARLYYTLSRLSGSSVMGDADFFDGGTFFHLSLTSRTQLLPEDQHAVSVRLLVAQRRLLVVAVLEVELPRQLVVRQRRRLDEQYPAALAANLVLQVGQQFLADALGLSSLRHGNPV